MPFASALQANTGIPASSALFVNAWPSLRRGFREVRRTGTQPPTAVAASRPITADFQPYDKKLPSRAPTSIGYEVKAGIAGTALTLNVSTGLACALREMSP